MFSSTYLSSLKDARDRRIFTPAGRSLVVHVFIFYILHPKEEKMPPTDNLHSPFHPTPYKYVGMQPKKIDILDSNATCR